VLEIAKRFAGVRVHGDAVEEFRLQVSREAGPLATLDWVERFSGLYVNGIACLTLYSEAMNRAWATALNLYTVGAHNIPDPYLQAKQDLEVMHTLDLVSDTDLAWGLEKLRIDQADTERERQLLFEWIQVEHQADLKALSCLR
jgi:hypothetical protein